MYQAPSVKMWLNNTFYNGPYGLAQRLPWKLETPAESFMAANLFVSLVLSYISWPDHQVGQFCLILCQYEMDGTRNHSLTLSSATLQFKQHYHVIHDCVAHLVSQPESGPIFKKYRQSLAAQLGKSNYWTQRLKNPIIICLYLDSRQHYPLQLKCQEVRLKLAVSLVLSSTHAQAIHLRTRYFEDHVNTDS
jgi:hypothetical protein